MAANGVPAQGSGSPLAPQWFLQFRFGLKVQRLKMQEFSSVDTTSKLQGQRGSSRHCLVLHGFSQRDRSLNDASSRSCKQLQVVSCRIGIIPLPCFLEAVVTGLPLSKHSG